MRLWHTSIRSPAPRRRHGVVPQTWTWAFLPTRWIFCDLRLGPGEILIREREARGLQFLRCEAADGHRSVSHCTRRAAFALSASIRASQNALAVPNTL